ncbi:hypothetical protein PS15m_009079 [Mucor circinelloides]
MNPDYDYSIYANLKIISIVDPLVHPENTLSPFTTYRIRHHESIESYYLRTDFLYNQQDTNDVRFGALTQSHFLKYPAEKQYKFVQDFLAELFQMYLIEGVKTANTDLYLATRRYLVLARKKMYGTELQDRLPKSQFVTLFPVGLLRDKEFIDDIVRPLLIEASWMSHTDPKSKLLFLDQLEATLYGYQSDKILSRNFLEIKREKRYLCCLIQSGRDGDSLTLQLDIIHMRYDTHFIAATKSSLSSSENPLLGPKFLPFSKTIHIPSCVSKKLLELPRFLITRIFAGSPHKISFLHGDLLGFYLGERYKSIRYLMEQFLQYMNMHKGTFDWNECIDKDIVSHLCQAENLEENERNNLAGIRWSELSEFLHPMDMSYVLDEIQRYIKKHEFILHNADDIIFVSSPMYKDRYFNMQNFFRPYQEENIKRAIYSLIRGEEFPRFDFSLDLMRCKEGILFKILTMIELSNRLQKPAVLSMKAIRKNEHLVNTQTQKREETLIEKIPCYECYVEAKITCGKSVKLYLHQVIDTMDGKQKSTLPINSAVIDIGSMCHAICDVLWNASQECSPVDCTSSLTNYDHYMNFKASLTSFLDGIFENELSKEDGIHDLHDMHVGSAECTCTVHISHGMILDMGIKSYLNSIAQSITSCLKNTFAFGKYKVRSLIITGSLLHKWTKLKNTLYRKFIWNQLQEELCLSLHHHQMRVQLVMSHIDIDLFPDEKLVKWEKYQQVLGEKRVFVEIQQSGISAKLYQDAGDRYKLIPSFQRDGREYWGFLLAEDTGDVLDQSGISKRYYIVPNRNFEENFFAKEAVESESMTYRISKNRFAHCLLACLI